MSSPYLLVSGDFVRTGGMDMANFALARYLAESGRKVHLVAHRVDPELSRYSNVEVHVARKPLNSYSLGSPFLDGMGRSWASRIRSEGGRVLVNGGNCQWGDANWVHYVHASYAPGAVRPALRRVKLAADYQLSKWREGTALRQARIVISNSRRTETDLVQLVRVAEERIETIYYGIDASMFRPYSSAEIAEQRAKLGWPGDRIVVAFVGALGDRRKGFDSLFHAWESLCADPSWDADLVVIGTGSELEAWRSRAEACGLQKRIQFLGFRKDVPQILPACDAMVAPTRYEAYGLAVQEALACGLPCLVSQGAGVAERYPKEIRDLLISNPDDSAEIANRLKNWRKRMPEWRAALAPFSRQLREYSWADMARRIVETVEVHA